MPESVGRQLKFEMKFMVTNSYKGFSVGAPAGSWSEGFGAASNSKLGNSFGFSFLSGEKYRRIFL